MKMALALLDDAREFDAAARLQHAISLVEREPIPRSIEEATAMPDMPAARILMQRISVES